MSPPEQGVWHQLEPEASREEGPKTLQGGSSTVEEGVSASPGEGEEEEEGRSGSAPPKAQLGEGKCARWREST